METRKNWFIYTTDEINPTRKMLFQEISVRSTIGVSWISMDLISRAVAFSSKTQALIYLYQYIKPFVATDKFNRINVIELDTTYIDTIKECLFCFKEDIE